VAQVPVLLVAPLDPLVVPVPVVPLLLVVVLGAVLVVVLPPVRLAPHRQPGAAAPAVALRLVAKVVPLVCLQTSAVFWLSLSLSAWLSCPHEGIAVRFSGARGKEQTSN